MSVLARVLQDPPEKQFAIYWDGALVANVQLVTGLAKAIEATDEAGFDPSGYVPGLHVAGLETAATIEWFAAWRKSGEKRDLVVRDHQRERSVVVTGAFIGAWSDGNGYDLVIETAVVDTRRPA